MYLLHSSPFRAETIQLGERREFRFQMRLRRRKRLNESTNNSTITEEASM